MTDQDDETPQEASGRDPRDQSRAYQGAMEAAFAIPIAGGIGWWLDSILGSAPFGLLVGLGLGFIVCVQRLLKLRSHVEAWAEEGEAPDPLEFRDDWSGPGEGLGAIEHEPHDDPDEDR